MRRLGPPDVPKSVAWVGVAASIFAPEPYGFAGHASREGAERVRRLVRLLGEVELDVPAPRSGR